MKRHECGTKEAAGKKRAWKDSQEEKDQDEAGALEQESLYTFIANDDTKVVDLIKKSAEEPWLPTESKRRKSLLQQKMMWRMMKLFESRLFKFRKC